MLLTLSLLLNKEWQHTLIVSSNGILIKSDLTPRLATRSSSSYSAISLANLTLFFTVYTFVVIDTGRGATILARLYVGVLIADITGLKGGQFWSKCLWTLKRP